MGPRCGKLPITIPTIGDEVGGETWSIFWNFQPLFGEMIPNLTSILFKWVGSTTN